MTLEHIKNRVLELCPNAIIVFHFNGIYYKNQKKSTYGYVIKEPHCGDFIEVGDYCKKEIDAWKTALSELRKKPITPHQKSDN